MEPDEAQGGRPAPALGEFVALMALLVSLTALTIDAMLPALPRIATDLGEPDTNTGQHIVTFMFVGYCLGQLIYGPMSDSVGRKPAMYLGVAMFSLGCVVSISAPSFTVMLIGRVLQGIGSASLRVVSIALVRDQYTGHDMARIMALIMGVFILVPAVAPTIGQALMHWFHWKAIFYFLLVQALGSALWLFLRQPETLAARDQKRLSAGMLLWSAREVGRSRVAVGYTVTSGLVFGGMVGYLTSAQQIFQGLYGVGDRFPVFFGALALAIGMASVINSRLVARLGMRRLSYYALSVIAGSGTCFSLFAWAHAGQPPLWTFMAFMLCAFLGIGLVFGNFSALAMEPLGHIAGMGATLVGAGSTLVSVIMGTVIGDHYDGTVLPLAVGFAVLGSASLAMMTWIERASPDHS